MTSKDNNTTTAESSPAAPKVESTVVSKAGATLEVRVIEISNEAKQSIARGLKLGKAAAYFSAAR